MASGRNESVKRLQPPAAPAMLLATRKELLRVLFEQSIPALLIDLIALSAVMLLFMFANAPRDVVVAWALGIAFVALARYMLAKRFNEGPKRQENLHRWHWAYLACTLAYGLLWGLAGLHFIVEDVETSYVVIIFLLCGLCAGAVVVYAASYATVVLFIAGVFSPFTLKLFYIGSESALMAVAMSLAWGGFAMIVGWRSHLQIKQRIQHQVYAEQLALQLGNARAIAERESSAKSRFMASMNHELRTPMNAIIGFSEMIRNETFGPVGNENYREYIGLIHQSAFYLHHLIADLLDLSRLETGKFALDEKNAVSLNAVVQDSETTVNGAYPALDIRSNAMDGARQLRGRFDPVRIKQVIVNILSNAAKFSQPNSPVLVQVLLDDDGNARVRIADRGKGIAMEDIPRLLQPFEQVDEADKTEGKGLGLGLAISKTIMESHGGALEIESAKGIGTIVTLVLPAERIETPRETVQDPLRDRDLEERSPKFAAIAAASAT